MDRKKYRPCVAMIVLNEEGKLLCCERSDINGAWQFPQGGVDHGESLEDAVFRELKEEIGTNKVAIIGRLSEAINYDWPENFKREGYDGQELTFFLVKLESNAQIDLEQAKANEFQKYEWLTKREVAERLTGFKTDAYTCGLEKLAQQFSKEFAD